MRKISELLKQQKAIEEQRGEANLIDTALPQPTQSLVLFNGVLAGEKLIHLPEIETLVNHFYGGLALTLVETENAEQLHDWAREEQYKADAQEHAMIYHMKTKFEDLTLDTYSDQFSGPLYIQVGVNTGGNRRNSGRISYNMIEFPMLHKNPSQSSLRGIFRI